MRTHQGYLEVFSLFSQKNFYKEIFPPHSITAWHESSVFVAHGLKGRIFLVDCGTFSSFWPRTKLTLHQMTNFRLVQIESICRRKKKASLKLKFVSERVENIVEKGEMLVTSIFSFCHNVFK